MFFVERIKAQTLKNIVFFSPIIIFTLFLLWEPLNLSNTFDRFNNRHRAAAIISESGNFDIITGKGTARSLAFSYFFERISKDSWFIGYGWGVPKENKFAWFGDRNIKRSGYHNLYYSMIPLFGWFGSFWLLFIIIYIFYNLRRLITTNNLLIKHISRAFYMMLLVILINEYKISALRIETYGLIFWIILGLSLSIIISKKQIRYE
jgi:hypothetical protein